MRTQLSKKAGWSSIALVYYIAESHEHHQENEEKTENLFSVNLHGRCNCDICVSLSEGSQSSISCVILITSAILVSEAPLVLVPRTDGELTSGRSNRDYSNQYSPQKHLDLFRFREENKDSL